MIPRITRGSSAGAALGYDFGPGRREEHVDARTVAGNVAGTWRDQAGMIDEAVARRPGVEKGIWRTSLRAAPGDPVLSDEAWGRIAERYVAAMGVGECPWTATRHGDDHIHLTVSRVTWEGKVKSLSHDYAKAQSACRGIEREHHLLDASTRYDRDRPQVSHGERESAARRTVVPEREQLREKVAAATTAAARIDGSREAFQAQLSAQGVTYRCNIASTGRVWGYSYALAGHTDTGGAPVFFKGSQLGKEHTWAATRDRLLDDMESTPVRGGVAADADRDNGRSAGAGPQANALTAPSPAGSGQDAVSQRAALAEAVRSTAAAHTRAAAVTLRANLVLGGARSSYASATEDLQAAQRRLTQARAHLAEVTEGASLVTRARERLTGYPRRTAAEAGVEVAVADLNAASQVLGQRHRGVLVARDTLAGTKSAEAETARAAQEARARHAAHRAQEGLTPFGGRRGPQPGEGDPSRGDQRRGRPAQAPYRPPTTPPPSRGRGR